MSTEVHNAILGGRPTLIGFSANQITVTVEQRGRRPRRALPV